MKPSNHFMEIMVLFILASCFYTKGQEKKMVSHMSFHVAF